MGQTVCWCCRISEKRMDVVRAKRVDVTRVRLPDWKTAIRLVRKHNPLTADHTTVCSSWRMKPHAGVSRILQFAFVHSALIGNKPLADTGVLKSEDDARFALVILQLRLFGSSLLLVASPSFKAHLFGSQPGPRSDE